MGKIKKIIENELIGGTQSTDIYPVTSTKAVYDEDNENLDSILKRRGIINVSTNYNSTHTAETLTLEQAIDKVPLKDRVLGFTMTFLSSDGWKTYQFTGTSTNNWTDTNNWIRIVDNKQLDSATRSIEELQDNLLITNDKYNKLEQSNKSLNDKVDGIESNIRQYYAGAQASLENAIASVPQPYQVGGLVLTFDKDGKSLSYKLTTSDWSTIPDNWDINQGTVINNTTNISGDVINNPDGEDLASVDGKLQFADCEYTPNNIDGMGKVYLRKNVKNEAVKTEEDVTSTSTLVSGKYYDFSRGVGKVCSVQSRWSMSSLIINNIKNGDQFTLNGDYTSNYGKYFWAVLNSNNKILACGGITDVGVQETLSEVVVIDTSETPSKLVMNFISYANPPYSAIKVSKSSNTIAMNMLNQSIFNNQKTIYIIRYDYDLNLGSLILPKDSVLWFQGGSIKRGNIRGKNTRIIAESDDNIFGRETNISGTWKNINWYPAWFGASADGETDDTEVLQKCLDLGEALRHKVNIIMYGKTYRTTKGLFLKSSTYLYGGTLDAKFEDPLDWVLQTYALYDGKKVVGYRNAAAWQDFDDGHVRQTSGSYIEDLTINGNLNLNDDGTYAPIYGGLRIQASDTSTLRVKINNVGVGMCRCTSIQAFDRNMNVQAFFRAYFGWCINGATVYDCYLNSHAHTTKVSESDTSIVIPYATEYHDLFKFGTSYIDGTEGIDDADTSKTRPLFCSIKVGYAGMSFINPIVDYYSEVAIAAFNTSKVTIVSPWWESIAKCQIATNGSRITCISPIIVFDAEYDIQMYGDSIINLIGCDNLNCSGEGIKGSTTKKLYAPLSSDRQHINVLGEFSNNYPPSDKFRFLSANVNRELGTYSDRLKYGNDSIIKIMGEYIFDNRISTINIKSGMIGRIYNFGAVNKDVNLHFVGVDKTKSVLLIELLKGRCKPYNVATFENLYIKAHSMQTFNNLCNNVTFINCIIEVNTSDLVEFPLCKLYFYNCKIIAKEKNYLFTSNVYLSNTTFSLGCRYGYAIDNALFLDIKTNKQKGTTTERNALSFDNYKGLNFYNIDINRNEVWNGRQWVLMDGYPYIPVSGTTDQLPQLPNMKEGSIFYDTTQNKKYELTTNGKCACAEFRITFKGFPKLSQTLYIGTTAVPVVDGKFSVNLPSGSYPVSCEGYDVCVGEPNQVTTMLTVSKAADISIGLKQSFWTRKTTQYIVPTDSEGNFMSGLTLMAGPYKATEDTNRKRYTVSVPNGNYKVMAVGYTEMFDLIVDGDTQTLSDIKFVTEIGTETFTITGTEYNKDAIISGEDKVVTDGTIKITVGDASINVPVKASDIKEQIPINGSVFSIIRSSIANMVLREWFKAGHYGEYQYNPLGVKLYTDNTITGDNLTATWDSGTTNLTTNSILKSKGTPAIWTEIQ